MQCLKILFNKFCNWFLFYAIIIGYIMLIPSFFNYQYLVMARFDNYGMHIIPALLLTSTVAIVFYYEKYWLNTLLISLGIGSIHEIFWNLFFHISFKDQLKNFTDLRYYTFMLGIGVFTILLLLKFLDRFNLNFLFFGWCFWFIFMVLWVQSGFNMTLWVFSKNGYSPYYSDININLIESCSWIIWIFNFLNAYVIKRFFK